MFLTFFNKSSTKSIKISDYNSLFSLAKFDNFTFHFKVLETDKRNVSLYSIKLFLESSNFTKNLSFYGMTNSQKRK